MLKYFFLLSVYFMRFIHADPCSCGDAIPYPKSQPLLSVVYFLTGSKSTTSMIWSIVDGVHIHMIHETLSIVYIHSLWRNVFLYLNRIQSSHAIINRV